jgi:hypothetical protein
VECFVLLVLADADVQTLETRVTMATPETDPKINGEPTYSSKFIPKLTAIPIVNSIKKHLYTHIPQAESLTTYVGDRLNVAFSYTNDTPIQTVLIKLDTLAADGVAKLEKEVPIVTTPTEEVLKRTKIDVALVFLAHYYTASVLFVLNLFNAYKSVFDPAINSFLDRFEVFLGIKASKPETQSARVKRIREVIVEKVDSQVTPILNKSKETVTSFYSSRIAPLVQYPVRLFYAEKEKTIENFTPFISELTSRYTKAETAAKGAWANTKPDISGPNAVFPALKSSLFVAITFGYNFVYPEETKLSTNAAEDQTNGLVSGAERRDGEAKKRPNGVAK